MIFKLLEEDKTNAANNTRFVLIRCVLFSTSNQMFLHKKYIILKIEMWHIKAYRVVRFSTVKKGSMGLNMFSSYKTAWIGITHYGFCFSHYFLLVKVTLKFQRLRVLLVPIKGLNWIWPKIPLGTLDWHCNKSKKNKTTIIWLKKTLMFSPWS